MKAWHYCNVSRVVPSRVDFMLSSDLNYSIYRLKAAKNGFTLYTFSHKQEIIHLTGVFFLPGLSTFPKCLFTAPTKRVELLSLIQQFPANQMKKTFSFSGSDPARPSHCLRRRQMCPCWIGCRKKNNNSQLYLAFARIVPLCMRDSREQPFGNKAPTRQTRLWAQGVKWEWDECFFKLLFPPKIFFKLSFSNLHLIPLMAERIETGTKYHSKCFIYIFRIFLLGFHFHALLVLRWL